jgi:hypothetical protein
MPLGMLIVFEDKILDGKPGESGFSFHFNWKMVGLMKYIGLYLFYLVDKMISLFIQPSILDSKPISEGDHACLETPLISTEI